jgi:hypothetical protein
VNNAGRGAAATSAVGRAFLVLAAFVPLLAAAGPSNQATPPGLASIGRTDPATAHALLERFQASGLVQPYYLEFQLQTMPHHGDVVIHAGRVWGMRNEQGLILRFAIKDGAGREHRFLLQNGPSAKAWFLEGSRVEVLGVQSLFKPIIEGVAVSPFDMQMPYLYWPDVTMAAVTRVLGRPANPFVFRPPTAFAAGETGLASVRAYFDAEFNEPVRTELLDGEGRIQKTLSLVDLKKIGKQWIPREVDVREEATRDKTRIFVTAAALGLDLSPALFLPEELAFDVAAPPERLLVRLPS